MANNITITVRNETADRYLYITAFGKPEEANPLEMYDTLFPVAWRVLPLGPDQHVSTIYPMQLQLSVKEHQKEWDAIGRATVKDVNLGQIWSFERYPKDASFTQTTLVPGETGKDGLVGLENNAPQYIDAGLAKNGTLLMVQRRLPRGELANFKLTPKLFWLFTSDLQEGDLIKSEKMEEQSFTLDLTNLASVTLSVVTTDPGSGELGWAVSDRVEAS